LVLCIPAALSTRPHGLGFWSLDETASFERIEYSASRTMETGFCGTAREPDRQSRVGYRMFIENTPFQNYLVRFRLPQKYPVKVREELMLNGLLLWAAAYIGNVAADRARRVFVVFAVKRYKASSPSPSFH
jgi:hypothetical protein